MVVVVVAVVLRRRSRRWKNAERRWLYGARLSTSNNTTMLLLRFHRRLFNDSTLLLFLLRIIWLRWVSLLLIWFDTPLRRRRRLLVGLGVCGGGGPGTRFNFSQKTSLFTGVGCKSCVADKRRTTRGRSSSSNNDNINSPPRLHQRSGSSSTGLAF